MFLLEEELHVIRKSLSAAGETVRVLNVCSTVNVSLSLALTLDTPHKKKTSGSLSGHQGGAESLQVVAHPLDLVNEEVDVGLSGRVVGHHHAEEVDFVALRLVAHHGGPRLHHHGLDLWRHLEQEKGNMSLALN